MIPSRLSRADAPRPHPAAPCPATFPREPSTRCEGVEGHDGPHVARVTVCWFVGRSSDAGAEHPASIPLAIDQKDTQ